MLQRVVKKCVIPMLLILLALINIAILNWGRIEMLGVTTIRNSITSYNRNVVYKDYNWLIGEQIDVVYSDVDSDLSEFIMELSQESFEMLEDRYSFTPNARPLVVIYPSYQALLESLGWDEKNKVSGVYQSGTIKIVSPKEWYPVDVLEEIKNVYRNFGPLHHEMTHLFVDYLTKGNYPDWYTEALAQLEELKLLNIEWVDSYNQNPKALYTFNQLSNGFYHLENQALAYRQSLTIGIFMEEHFGKEAHFEVLYMLSKGNSFKTSIQKLYDVSVDEFEMEYNLWIESNWNDYF